MNPTQMSMLEAASIPASELNKMRYLLELNPGKSKGFQMMGYTAQRPSQLYRALQTLTRGNPFKPPATSFGMKYEYTQVVTGPNGVSGTVTSTWIQDSSTGAFRIITAIARPHT